MSVQEIMKNASDGTMSHFECRTELLRLYKANVISYGELNILAEKVNEQPKRDGYIEL